jgi:hypothetical protein
MSLFASASTIPKPSRSMVVAANPTAIARKRSRGERIQSMTRSWRRCFSLTSRVSHSSNISWLPASSAWVINRSYRLAPCASRHRLASTPAPAMGCQPWWTTARVG